jgi:very-short-patch-repair endonuclease
MWTRLRGKQVLGRQFYRQKPIGNYIVDFYAPTTRLVIELDGGHHFDTAQASYDRRRSEYLEKLGLKVFRFDDRQVLLELDSVVQVIFRAASESLEPL